MQAAEKRKIIAIIIMVSMFVGISIWWQESNRVVSGTVVEMSETVKEAMQKQLLTVNITGAVTKPGIYKISPDSIVADLVEKAGGLLESADKDKLNMAKACYDGMHVNVKYQKVVMPKKSSNKKGKVVKNESTIIALNSANASDLENLPGIGPALAKKIIIYRDENGLFQTIEQLKDVSGIGDAKFEMLKNRVTL